MGHPFGCCGVLTVREGIDKVECLAKEKVKTLTRRRTVVANTCLAVVGSEVASVAHPLGRYRSYLTRARFAVKIGEPK